MTRDKKEFIEAMLTWFRSPKVSNDEELDREFLSNAYDSITYPHWISVKDRKPKLKHSIDNIKYSDRVIVTNGEYRTSASWKYNTWAGWYGWFTDGDEELKDITHWMFLPSVEHLKDK